ncbi:hypothetical protein J6590_023665 [Homalodisca vitripennis]|nr:hypothetical protein J6590_023665 [Homalodisca vitripennis]
MTIRSVDESYRYLSKRAITKFATFAGYRRERERGRGREREGERERERERGRGRERERGGGAVAVAQRVAPLLTPATRRYIPQQVSFIFAPGRCNASFPLVSPTGSEGSGRKILRKLLVESPPKRRRARGGGRSVRVRVRAACSRANGRRRVVTTTMSGGAVLSVYADMAIRRLTEQRLRHNRIADQNMSQFRIRSHYLKIASRFFVGALTCPRSDEGGDEKQQFEAPRTITFCTGALLIGPGPPMGAGFRLWTEHFRHPSAVNLGSSHQETWTLALEITTTGHVTHSIRKGKVPRGQKP